MTRRSLVVLLALLFAVATVQPVAAGDRHAPRGIPGAVPLSADADLAAWQRLQYGMFIHWGIYSELGGVWQGQPVTSGYSEQIQMWANIPEADYLDVASRFDPTRFDPAAICSLAKQAGMRYVVITSKHHDGFSMFDTATTGYDVVDATAYGRDPLKLLANECRRQGLGFGFYFSLVDWHQGHEFDGGNNNPIPASMEPVIEAQLRELMSNYGEISEVWFDMSTPTVAQSTKFAGIVRELQPHAAVNSRIWNNVGDFRTLGDNEIPSVPLDGTWQTPASVYHETWGYRSWQERDDLPGKVRDLVTGLTSVRARGGNYLLNIGPRGDGSVVEFEADVLRGMGDWLRRHPGAVLGAQATRFGGQPWGEVTVNGRDLFLHVTHWPSAGELRLPGLATKVRDVREDGANRLRWHRSGDDLVVTLPATPHDEVLPVVRVRLGGELRIIPPNTVPGGPLDFEQGYSYADDGGYPSTHRTTVRQTAYVTGQGGASYVVLRGSADPATRYRVSVGDRSKVVTGAELVSTAVGPFTMPARQVIPVTVTLASPPHQGADLSADLTAAVVAPANTVTGWVEAPARLELGEPAALPVHATNLTPRPVSGRVGDVPFTNLAPGATFTATVPFTLPTSPGTHSLTAPVHSTARTVNLRTDIELVLPNVARGKQATQVSTAWGGVPERAVDGNTAGDYLRDNTASHTAEPSNQAWWQVDLGQEYRLAQLEIWNRGDCCMDRLSNYWVLISDAPLTANSLQEALATPGVTALHQTTTAGRPTVLDLDAVQGRHVRVQLESATDPLSLTEVVVRAQP
ncbi:alpha-L-fucosidase [Actinophytocola algeriensis]|uniref:alpha-L-fucosidase n=1 Tax=Actinophytocola algeriensis TaxID=1768010 RepID=A0A7W7Q281_9PSEU|nr:alpha-L-fucosidase [Actinophytocola algeriensis]MBB4905456.1 alpha-L-fucosidase [Actinophytocola algeriensis]MBE1472859.1 alpha-L-fucosidase [Actinophytocola algeriensis]